MWSSGLSSTASYLLLVGGHSMQCAALGLTCAVLGAVGYRCVLGAAPAKFERC